VVDRGPRHNAQAQAAASARPGTSRAGEPLEDPLAILRRNSGASIADPELDVVVGRLHPNLREPPAVQVCILEQVHQRPQHLATVHVHGRIVDPCSDRQEIR
jgi:hypothetical protein